MGTNQQGLWIKRLNHDPFLLQNVSVNWDVQELKCHIQTVKGLGWDIVELHHNSQVLQDKRRLSSYGIKPGDTILLTLRDGIEIADLGGKKIIIRHARMEWTVGELKAAIRDATGIDVKCIQLLLLGKLMDDNRCLSTYNMRKGQRLLMTRRWKGGSSLF